MLNTTHTTQFNMLMNEVCGSAFLPGQVVTLKKQNLQIVRTVLCCETVKFSLYFPFPFVVILSFRGLVAEAGGI